MPVQVSPRDLQRRKFQHVAATTMDKQASVIGQLVEAINQTNESARVSREFVADLSARVDALARETRETFALWDDPAATAKPIITRRLWERHVELDNRLYRLESLTFLGRLRWLLTGK